MKKQIVGAALFALNCIATLTACKKTEHTSNSTPVALQAIQSDPNLKIFAAIEAKAGDDALFTNGYTYLVPEDNSFISQGITQIIAQNMSQASADSIIRYSTVPSIIHFNGGNAETMTATSITGTDLFADSTNNAFYFNGVATDGSPVMVGSSVIYKLIDVLPLPASSITALAAADPDLSLLNEAMARTNLTSNFISNNNYTLFMPTNTAFINAGYPDVASIDAADITVLTQLILYHSLLNTYFPNDISLQSSLTTLQGTGISIDTSSGTLQLKGNSDPGDPAILLSKGIVAGNVTAYKINTVLLP